MSVTAMSRTFWTEFPTLAYTDKKGKQITIKDTTAKIVLLAIADNADDFGENSYQSFETLAKKASVDRRSVMRVVRALVANGFLVVAGLSVYGTNNYSICLDKLGTPPAKRAKTGRPKSGDSEALGLVVGDSEVKTDDSKAKSDDPVPPESSLSIPDSSIKEKIMNILHQYAWSVFPNPKEWERMKRRLEEDNVTMTCENLSTVAKLDDPMKIMISGLSRQWKTGPFKEAAAFEDMYYKSFANLGLELTFTE